MTRTVMLFLGFALLMPIQASAQWSPDERQVIEDLAACWDIWMEAIDRDNPELWLDQCTDGDFSYWWALDGAPNGPAMLRRNWERVKRTDIGWLDIRPIGIKIIDDVAIVHFYGYWDAQTDNGPQAAEMMRTEVFRQMDGRWVLVAGHSTPASAADASAYQN